MEDQLDSAPLRELFVSDYSQLPLPFPGETLYSWCARFHRINGNTSARLTSRQLFGSSTAGLRHDFPTHLTTFFTRTNLLFSSIDDLIYQRTVFGFYAPLLTSSAIDSIIHNMREGEISRIKYHLGILPSRTGSSAPLKACPSCISSDANRSGTSWWHIEHQWPTSRLCQTHGDYLLTPPLELHGRILKEWLLPNDIRWQSKSTPDEQTLTTLHSLYRWGNYFVICAHNPFDRNLLRLAYHLKAKANGWTSMDGSLKFSQIKMAFRNKYERLGQLGGFEFINETAQDHGGFLGSLLRQFEGTKHPLKHALMMDFLFDEPTKFDMEYQRIRHISLRSGAKGLWSALTEERRQLKLMVTELGYSVNAASNQLGIPVGMAARYLNKEGVECKRRPHVLNPEMETALRQLLGSGEEREYIASTLGVRKAFIREYLARHPDLRVTWVKQHEVKVIEKYRTHFKQLLSEHPSSTLKKLKQIPGSGIQWLARHDKEWLENSLPSLWKRKTSAVDK